MPFYFSRSCLRFLRSVCLLDIQGKKKKKTDDSNINQLLSFLHHFQVNFRGTLVSLHPGLVLSILRPRN